MRKPKKEIQLTSYDELLGINEAEQNTLNQIVEVPLNELHPFRNHPFHVNDDEKMAETVESIKNYGILNPALVRPRAEGGYELIAGHRRKRGCELAGKSKMPVLIRNYTDDEAVIVMVDSNIQRENLLPSEKAYAYKMKMDAVKHQGIKDENAASVDSADLVGQAAGDSGRTVQRYIRLTCLIPELLKLLDEGKINFTVGVSLTYLSETEQIWVKDCIVSGASSVTGSMATKMFLLVVPRNVGTGEMLGLVVLKLMVGSLIGIGVLAWRLLAVAGILLKNGISGIIWIIKRLKEMVIKNERKATGKIVL